MAGTPVILVLDDAADVAVVQTRAADAGLEEIKALSGLGMLHGSIAEDRIADLARIEGVRSVEREGGVSLPPPDSPIQ